LLFKTEIVLDVYLPIIPFTKPKALTAASKTGAATASAASDFFIIYLKKLRINKNYRRSKIKL
jgi:hypothetical protein